MCFESQVSVEKIEVMTQKAKTSTIHNIPVIKIREPRLQIFQHSQYLGWIIAHDYLISKETNARIQKSNDTEDKKQCL